MNKNFQIFLLVLLLPTVLETISASEFSISVPGSPFSLGRITFVFVGFIGIIKNRGMYNSATSNGLFMIFIGGIIGALFSNQVDLNLARSFGIMLLFFASLGFVNLWYLSYFKLFLDLFFILNFCYWNYYVYDLILSKGFSFIAYSQLFANQEAVNHHIIGLNSSVSCIYLSLRYFYINNQLKISGFIIIFIGIIICFLIESRSNFIVTIFILLLIVYYSNYKFYKLILLIIPLFFIMYFIIRELAGLNDLLFQRFDITDSDYQERTTGMRFDFIQGFLKAFANKPFGTGVIEAQIEYGQFKSVMLHNQYLTFILSSGLISIFGIYLWLTEFYKNVKRIVKQKIVNKYVYAIIFTTLTFLLTLFTIDSTGLLFFICLSLLLSIDRKNVYRPLNSLTKWG